MIARVAESCFWLHRYVERVDNTARLMGVNFAFLLDLPNAGVERWRPLLTVAGVEQDFIQLVGDVHLEDAELVQEYLTWTQENPVSAWNSLCWARENARTIRETLSLEAWTSINRFWLWMKSPEARKLYDAEPAVFYERTRENCQAFHGVCADTLLHDEPFEFMRLGMFLERAAQTTRILDTKYHSVGPTRREGETTAELAEWIAILRSCSAYEPFFKRAEGPLTGPAVAGFLLLDPAFPRSVTHCLLRARNFLELIILRRPDTERRSMELLLGLLERLRSRTIDDILEAGLHDELTETVGTLATICETIGQEFFSGQVPQDGAIAATNGRRAGIDAMEKGTDPFTAPAGDSPSGYRSEPSGQGPERPQPPMSPAQDPGDASFSPAVAPGDASGAPGPASGATQTQTGGEGAPGSSAAQLPRLEDVPPVGEPPTGFSPATTAIGVPAISIHVSAGEDARILSVNHETIYSYHEPVFRSSHLFLLRPVDDARQDVLEYDLKLSVDGERGEFEDVFGNHVLDFRPRGPFTELRIESRSLVRVRGSTESSRIDNLGTLPHPVVWMPWQRMMMLPYLMPPELPESELSELSRYAHHFVQRNDGDLVRVLSDLNLTIHGEFTYEPGSTTLETTPFETFVRRRGVCQDFAYLFISLAQLLNVPARYRVGYIYTGGDYEGQLRSDASHAWAEVYLPRIGWYGFDPANGKATRDVDYVRVATGRHYRDAAPVTGTIYEGGGGERLEASVRVELVG